MPAKSCLYALTGMGDATGSDWIWKSDKNNYNFKRRWCVLKGNLFYYYETQQALNPKGYWDLKLCDLGRIKETEGSNRFRFKLTLKEDKDVKEDRILYVETDEKRENWLKLLLTAKECNVSLEYKMVNQAVLTPSRSVNVIRPKEGPPEAGPPKRPQKPPDLDKIPLINREGSVKSAPEIQEPQEPSYNDQLTVTEFTPEIPDLVSPRPYTNCYLSHKVYDDKNFEKERNMESLKSGRSVGLDEEWDEGESDWLSGCEEIDEDEGCLIM